MPDKKLDPDADLRAAALRYGDAVRLLEGMLFRKHATAATLRATRELVADADANLRAVADERGARRG